MLSSRQQILSLVIAEPAEKEARGPGVAAGALSLGGPAWDGGLSGLGAAPAGRGEFMNTRPFHGWDSQSSSAV